jgi:hypothetical protein
MRLIANYFRELAGAAVAGWNRFWFTPQDAATLGVIRICTGAMLFYTHAVWSLDLEGFFGSAGWLAPEALYTAYGGLRSLFWSHWHWIDNPTVVWTVHIAALVVYAMLTIGLFSRAVSILGWLLTVSYAHRVMPAALFGLDDINAMLSMYLMVGPCGAAYSVDSWLASRRSTAGENSAKQVNPRNAGSQAPPGNPLSSRLRLDFAGGTPSISANVSIRLMQIHLCIIYLFSALGKCMGSTWWDGSAMWLAVANYEYQSIDLTWLASSPEVLSLLAHVTVAWELSYAALIWPRLTRPIMVAMAIPLHLGIGIFLGMMTFGLAMVIANLAFVSPWVVRAVMGRRRSSTET